MISVTQSCLTLCDPTDCSLHGSSIGVVFQARILKWVAIFYSRGSSWPRDRTCISCVSCFGRWILYHWGAQGHSRPWTGLFRADVTLLTERPGHLCFIGGPPQPLSGSLADSFCISFLGCHNQVPQTKWLYQKRCVVSQFHRLEDQRFWQAWFLLKNQRGGSALGLSHWIVNDHLLLCLHIIFPLYSCPNFPFVQGH